MKKLGSVQLHGMCITLLLLVIIICSLVLRQFYTNPVNGTVQIQKNSAQKDQNRRAEIFAMYNDSLRYPDTGPGRMRIDIKVEEVGDFRAVEDEIQKKIFAVLEQTTSMLIYDEVGGETESTGNEIVTVTDRDGVSVRLVRIYREWHGDWKNWMEFIADAETGDIYYLYISSSCENNIEQYDVIGPAFESADDVAYWWGDLCNIEYLDMEEVTGGIYQKMAKYGKGNDVLKYLLGWNYIPGKLLDMKIQLKGW